jgi:DNA-binding Lrp family transcriptional regulator
MKNSESRRKLLIDTLQERGSISVEEIQAMFQVSAPTAYRDIHMLVEEGLARKTIGGIRLERQAASTPVRSPDHCAACGGTINARTAFLIMLESKENAACCCPHCGMMYLSQHPAAVSAMATDFLYGTVVPVRQTHFLLQSEVQVCCAPSVLAFRQQEDAAKFQSGFGGEVMAFDHLRTRMLAAMALDAGQPDDHNERQPSGS